MLSSDLTESSVWSTEVTAGEGVEATVIDVGEGDTVGDGVVVAMTVKVLSGDLNFNDTVGVGVEVGTTTMSIVSLTSGTI